MSFAVLLAGWGVWRLALHPLLEHSRMQSARVEAERRIQFTNSLGMKFVPVAGTEVLFSIWETRVADYRAYASAKAGVDRSWENPVCEGQRVISTEDCPVVNVSWEDAKAFCAWLTQKEQGEGKISSRQSYRLPTDWEWSVAVGLNERKGGTPAEKDLKTLDVYPWGSGWPPPQGAGNYLDKAAVRVWRNHERMMGFRVGLPDYDDGHATTARVGCFLPNRFGLYDLGGNVYEWCEDWFDDTHRNRVVRGASWAQPDFGFSLSSHRNYGPPDCRAVEFGFRCVLVVEPAP